MQIVRAGLSAILAGILTIILFLLVGAALPIWTMIAIYGSQAVEDSPAHGGMILFLSLPAAGIVSIPAFPVLTTTFYRKFRSHD